VYRLRCRRLL